MEGAAAGDGDGAGQVALKDDAFRLPCGVWQGDGGEESLGIGVGGVGKELLLLRIFHHFAQVHDRHMGGDVLYHTQIMGDEDQRDAQLLLQVHEQVDDLGLDGYVQRGNGFIGHDELRMDGQGAGDADALTLPAAEFVGKTVDVIG